MTIFSQSKRINPFFTFLYFLNYSKSYFGSQPQHRFTRLLVLLAMRGGLISLKQQGHTLPEAVVPDAVNNNITATVSCQNPEGKKGEITPGVSHHVPEHKHCNGREGCCKGKC